MILRKFRSFTEFSRDTFRIRDGKLTRKTVIIRGCVSGTRGPVRRCHSARKDSHVSCDVTVDLMADHIFLCRVEPLRGAKRTLEQQGRTLSPVIRSVGRILQGETLFRESVHCVLRPFSSRQRIFVFYRASVLLCAIWHIGGDGWRPVGFGRYL